MTIIFRSENSDKDTRRDYPTTKSIGPARESRVSDDSSFPFFFLSEYHARASFFFDRFKEERSARII